LAQALCAVAHWCGVASDSTTFVRIDIEKRIASQPRERTEPDDQRATLSLAGDCPGL
jgi:hypothetical protein